MSKYNLTDILEQYRIGSGWTTDFDYEGMLRSGLKTGVDTDIVVLKKMSDDFEDVNYHRENNHLQKAIDALEEGAIKEASMFFGDFHAEIKATMETFDMGIEPTLGKFMDSKMDLDEDKDKKDKDKEPRDGVKSAASKLGMKPSHIKEVRIDRDVAERIEGMLSIPLKRKFLDSFMDLWQDLIEEDPFYAEDVINHLNNEMHKEIDGYQATGDKLAGIGESFDSLAKKLDKQKGIDKDEAAKIAGSIAAKKAAGAGKGPTAKQKKRMKEASDTFNIDKVASPDAKAHDYGAEIKGISDEDDTEEKYAHQTVLPLEEDDYTDRKGRALYPILKAGANATGDEIEMYVQSLAKDIDLNGKEQYAEFTSDDFVEDFKEFISNKSLQEHFKRFM